MPREVIRAVTTRASGRCEYCLMHQSLQGATFHVEHVLPKSRGGSSDEFNLALCCPSCNLKKSDRVEAIDPMTGRIEQLFNPRTMHWDGHFGWSDFELVGKTVIGRTTIDALNLNHPRRMRIREIESTLGLFPHT